jgi:DNA-binding GntR family transcriptional regulator
VKSIYKTRSLTEKTYRRLERAILRRELEPGEPIVINDLAGKLGVSRTPVKEALLLLERSGLVEADDGRMHVANLSLGDLEEVFEVREAIELYAIGKIADAGEVSRQLANLYDALKEHRSPTGAEDAQHASELDLKFHRALVASAGNRRMLSIWDQMATELQRFWSDGVGNLSRIASDVDECVGIVDAIRHHDAQAASALLVRHLDQTKRSLASWRDRQHARSDGAAAPT